MCGLALEARICEARGEMRVETSLSVVRRMRVVAAVVVVAAVCAVAVVVEGCGGFVEEGGGRCRAAGLASFPPARISNSINALRKTYEKHQPFLRSVTCGDILHVS